MRRMPWTTYLWPGLAQIWLHGSWAGLAVALGAAAIFDVLLGSSFGWSELISRSLRNILWVIFALAWVTGVLWSVIKCRKAMATEDLSKQNDTFTTALDHYLRGDYYEAERILMGLLRQNSCDAEARLMLATLLRRTGKHDRACEELEALSRLETADKWALELEKERELLAAAKKKSAA